MDMYQKRKIRQEKSNEEKIFPNFVSFAKVGYEKNVVHNIMRCDFDCMQWQIAGKQCGGKYCFCS